MLLSHSADFIRKWRRSMVSFYCSRSCLPTPPGAGAPGLALPLQYRNGSCSRNFNAAGTRLPPGSGALPPRTKGSARLPGTRCPPRALPPARRPVPHVPAWQGCQPGRARRGEAASGLPHTEDAVLEFSCWKNGRSCELGAALENISCLPRL